MDLSCFFQPVQPAVRTSYPLRPDCLAHTLDRYSAAFPDWRSAHVVLLGCTEERGGLGREGCGEAADAIRTELDVLCHHWPQLRIADLGNLVPKADLEDVYFTLQYLCEQFIQHDKLALVLGGTHDLSWGLYQALGKLERRVDYVAIDAMPDIFDSERGLNHSSHHHRILSQSPSLLGRFGLLGQQNYLMSTEELTTLDTLEIEAVRLAELREDLARAECVLRLADLVSFDLSAVRRADAPAASHSTAAGLTLEEACRLARFAGMGYRLSLFHLCEFNPELDNQDQTASACALILWHLIDGFAHRPDDFPLADRSNLQTYRVAVAGALRELVFYRHEETCRWWMEVPAPKRGPRSRGGGNRLVACAESDYRQALREGIPDRWWKAQTYIT